MLHIRIPTEAVRFPEPRPNPAPLYLPDAHLDALTAHIDGLSVAENEVVLVLLCEATEEQMTALVTALNLRDLAFVGGSFPGIIHGNESLTRGAVVQVLPALAAPRRIPPRHDFRHGFPDTFGKAVRADAARRSTAMVLVDGLGTNIEAFLRALYDRFGDSVHYFGGGAGSLSLRQQPCLFSHEGVFRDGALVTFLDLDSRLGVRHGWKRLLGPLVVTQAKGNVICDINWSNAFEVYQAIIETEAKITLTRENFFSVAKEFPFGLFREGNEDIVRDPIAVTENGGLLCVGEVPENAVIHVLRGTPDALIESAGVAASDCLTGLREHVRSGLVVDCISRMLFLQDAYSQELTKVRDLFVKHGLNAPDGVLTLGEISSYGEGLLAFFNKTIVASIFYERRTVPA